MSRLDDQTQALLDRLRELSGGVRVDMRDLPIEMVREGARQTWLALAGEDTARCKIRSVEIPREDDPASEPLPARLYRPIDAAGSVPLVVYFHGGGWVMGDLDSYEPMVKALCESSGCMILSVDYRLAPEHPFPAGLEDAACAVEWALDHADRIECQADAIAVSGDSAGGNLAAVVAWQLGRTRPGALRGQFLIYPMLDVASDHSSYKSRRDFGAGEYLLANNDIDAVTDWYITDSTAHNDSRVSPLFAPEPERFPPTVIVSAGFDPLSSEGNRFAERLDQAGVACQQNCFETTIHAFMSFGDLDVAVEGRRWLAAQIRHLLS